MDPPEVDAAELYYLIADFLARSTPCQRAANVLREELGEHRLLGQAYDWEGRPHAATPEEVQTRYRHLPRNQLPKLLQLALQHNVAGGPSSGIHVRSVLAAVKSGEGTVEAVDTRRQLVGALRQLSECNEQLIRVNSAIRKAAAKHQQQGSEAMEVVAVEEEKTSGGNGDDDVMVVEQVDCEAMREASRHRVKRELEDRIASLQAAIMELTQRARTLGIMRTRDRHESCKSLVDVVLRRQLPPQLPPPMPRRPPTHLYSRVMSHMKTINGHMFTPVYCLKCDKKARFVVTGADDALVKVWSLQSARLMRTLRGHGGVLTDMAVSCDNTFLATSSEDRTIRIWSLKDGTPLAVLQGHRDSINYVQFHPLYNVLITASDDSTARVWDLRGLNDEDANILPQPQTIDLSTYGALRSPSRALAASVGSNSAVGAPTIFAHMSGALVESVGGALAAGGGGGGGSSNSGAVGGIGDGGAGSSSSGTGGSSLSRVKSVAVSPLGGHIATGDDKGVGRVWVLEGMGVLDAGKQAEESASGSDDGDEDGGGGDDSSSSGGAGKRPARHTRSAKRRSVSPPLTIVFPSGELPVPLPGQLACHLDGHKSTITDILYSNAGDRLLTASMADGTLRIWSWSSGLTNLSNLVLRVHDTKTEELPVPPGASDVLEAMRRRTRKPVLTPSIDSVVWTSDDQRVVTAQCMRPNDVALSDYNPDYQQCFKVWNSYTGELLHTLRGHDKQASVLQAHPTDSRIIMSAGYDGKVCLWDVVEGTCVMSFVNILDWGPTGNGDNPATEHSIGDIVALLDGQFTEDGCSFSVSDDCGRLLMFGADDSEKFRNVERQQYFLGDYDVLQWDAAGHVIDAAHQMPPHLIGRRPLVNAERTPYDPQPEYDITAPKPLSLAEMLAKADHVRGKAEAVRRIEAHRDMAKRGKAPSNKEHATGVNTLDGAAKAREEKRRVGRQHRRNPSQQQQQRQGSARVVYYDDEGDVDLPEPDVVWHGDGMTREERMEARQRRMRGSAEPVYEGVRTRRGRGRRRAEDHDAAAGEGGGSQGMSARERRARLRASRRGDGWTEGDEDEEEEEVDMSEESSEEEFEGESDDEPVRGRRVGGGGRVRRARGRGGGESDGDGPPHEGAGRRRGRGRRGAHGDDESQEDDVDVHEEEEEEEEEQVVRRRGGPQRRVTRQQAPPVEVQILEAENVEIVNNSVVDEFDDSIIASMVPASEATEGEPLPPAENSSAASSTPISVVDRAGLVCAFCGDGHSDDVPLPGPLLGPHPLKGKGNKPLWVHDECARWCPQVFEDDENRWHNIVKEVQRGRMIRCKTCKRVGAAIGCSAATCNDSFHYPCAVAGGWTFTMDTIFLCKTHRPRSTPEQRRRRQGHQRKPSRKHDRARRMPAHAEHAHDGDGSHACCHGGEEGEEADGWHMPEVSELSRKWLRSTKQDHDLTRRLVPQRRDVVVYLPRAHEEAVRDMYNRVKEDVVLKMGDVGLGGREGADVEVGDGVDGHVKQDAEGPVGANGEGSASVAAAAAAGAAGLFSTNRHHTHTVDPTIERPGDVEEAADATDLNGLPSAVVEETAGRGNGAAGGDMVAGEQVSLHGIEGVLVQGRGVQEASMAGTDSSPAEPMPMDVDESTASSRPASTTAQPHAHVAFNHHSPQSSYPKLSPYETAKPSPAKSIASLVDHKPWEDVMGDSSNRPAAVRCVIESVSYGFPANEAALVACPSLVCHATLRVTGVPAQNTAHNRGGLVCGFDDVQDGKTFEVDIVEDGRPGFLALEPCFTAAMAVAWEPGMRVAMPYMVTGKKVKSHSAFATGTITDVHMHSSLSSRRPSPSPDPEASNPPSASMSPRSPSLTAADHRPTNAGSCGTVDPPATAHINDDTIAAPPTAHSSPSVDNAQLPIATNTALSLDAPPTHAHAVEGNGSSTDLCIAEGGGSTNNNIERSAWLGSGFYCLEVQWDSEGVPAAVSLPTRVSPWEVVPCGGTVDDHAMPLWGATVIDAEISEGLRKGVENLKEVHQFSIFATPVTRKTRGYFELIPLNMELDLVCTRLQNGFYRTVEAVEDDLTLIVENCKAYNEQGSDIAEVADSLGVRAKRLIAAATARRDGRPFEDVDVGDGEHVGMGALGEGEEEQEHEEVWPPRRRTRMGRVRGAAAGGGGGVAVGGVRGDDYVYTMEGEPPTRSLPKRSARVEGESQRKRTMEILSKPETADFDDDDEEQGEDGHGRGRRGSRRVASRTAGSSPPPQKSQSRRPGLRNSTDDPKAGLTPPLSLTPPRKHDAAQPPVQSPTPSGDCRQPASRLSDAGPFNVVRVKLDSDGGMRVQTPEEIKQEREAGEELCQADWEKGEAQWEGMGGKAGREQDCGVGQRGNGGGGGGAGDDDEEYVDEGVEDDDDVISGDEQRRGRKRSRRHIGGGIKKSTTHRRRKAVDSDDGDDRGMCSPGGRSLRKRGFKPSYREPDVDDIEEEDGDDVDRREGKGSRRQQVQVKEVALQEGRLLRSAGKRKRPKTYGEWESDEEEEHGRTRTRARRELDMRDADLQYYGHGLVQSRTRGRRHEASRDAQMAPSQEPQLPPRTKFKRQRGGEASLAPVNGLPLSNGGREGEAASSAPPKSLRIRLRRANKDEGQAGPTYEEPGEEKLGLVIGRILERLAAEDTYEVLSAEAPTAAPTRKTRNVPPPRSTTLSDIRFKADSAAYGSLREVEAELRGALEALPVYFPEQQIYAAESNRLLSLLNAIFTDCVNAQWYADHEEATGQDGEGQEMNGSHTGIGEGTDGVAHDAGSLCAGEGAEAYS